MNSLEELSAKLAKEVSPDGWLCGPDAVEEYTRLLVAALGAQQEPVAWLFQHDETGRTMCVDAWQVENGFEHNNPRLQKLHPLFAAPVLPSVPGGVVQHVCGLQGFGALDDVCPACASAPSPQEDKP